VSADDLVAAHAALRALPTGHWLKLTIEESEEDEPMHYCATLLHDPPFEGWPSDAWYFRAEPGARSWSSHKYVHEPAVVDGVSAETPEACARLAIVMVVGAWGKFEAWLARTRGGSP